MNREEVLEIIAEARANGTDPALGRRDLRGIDLREVDMCGADLRGADLRGTCLTEADLSWSDLNGANLTDTVLSGADLREADLRDANLTRAHLEGANLAWSRGECMGLAGLPSGHASIQPTPHGWFVRVGCWSGTVDELEVLISSDKDWPEAEGEECVRRRPGLQAWIALCRAHIAAHQGIIERLVRLWPEEVAR